MKTAESEEPRQRVTILHKKDLDVSYFCGPGKGGQAKNKVHSGCQIIHRESGAIGRASDSRSLEQNKKSAFERLLATPKMKFWIAAKLYEVKHSETMEETAAKEMTGDKLRYEIKNADGKWTEVTSAYFETPAALKSV
jgi:protein subunit release factor A